MMQSDKTTDMEVVLFDVIDTTAQCRLEVERLIMEETPEQLEDVDALEVATWVGGREGRCSTFSVDTFEEED